MSSTPTPYDVENSIWQQSTPMAGAHHQRLEEAYRALTLPDDNKALAKIQSLMGPEYSFSEISAASEDRFQMDVMTQAVRSGRWCVVEGLFQMGLPLAVPASLAGKGLTPLLVTLMAHADNLSAKDRIEGLAWLKRHGALDLSLTRHGAIPLALRLPLNQVRPVLTWLLEQWADVKTELSPDPPATMYQNQFVGGHALDFLAWSFRMGAFPSCQAVQDHPAWEILVQQGLDPLKPNEVRGWSALGLANARLESATWGYDPRLAEHETKRLLAERRLDSLPPLEPSPGSSRRYRA